MARDAPFDGAESLLVLVDLPTLAHDSMRTGPGERDRRLHECAVRLRERLGAVRPALARARSLIPPAGARCDRDLLELSMADVTRALVQARRCVRALAGELAGLEAEARDLRGVVARVLADVEPEARLISPGNPSTIRPGS